MSRRIGIVVDRTRIHAVVLHRGRVLATAVREIEHSESVAGELVSLFETFGVLARRTSIRLAFDRPMAQVKDIPDAPRVPDRKVLERALRENADRYFIGGYGSHYFGVLANVECPSIIACERHVIDEVAHGAFASGAVGLVIASVRSLPDSRNPRVEPAFSAAYSLAMLDERTVPNVTVKAAAGRRRMRILGIVAAGTTVAGLLVAPIVRARSAAAAARHELNSIHGRSSAALKAVRDRDALRAMIDRVRPRGVAMTGLLAHITDALPVRAALLALRVDSTKGSAVILALDAVETLPALDSVSLIEEVRLSGPVTRERISERDFERATITFTVKPSR